MSILLTYSVTVPTFKALVTVDADEFCRNHPKTVCKNDTAPKYLVGLEQKYYALN